MSVNLKSVKSQEKPSQSEDSQFQIVKVADWNPDFHSLGEIKANKNGQGKAAALKYKSIGTKRFLLAAPCKMMAPFGASPPFKKTNQNGTQSTKQTEGDGDSKTFSVNLSFSNTDSQEEADFLEKSRQFDDNMITALGNMAISDPSSMDIETSKFRGSQKEIEQQIRAVVSSKYNSLLKEPKDKTKNYPPTINCKFQNDFKNPDLFSTAFFDNKRNPIVLSQNPNDENYICRVIAPHSRVTALLSANFWMAGKGCGFSLKVIQLIIYPTKSIPMDQCLLEDPSDEDDDEDNETADAEQNQSDDHETEPEAETAEEEQEEQEDDPIQEDDPVQEVVPEPVVVKAPAVALRPLVKAPLKAPPKK